MFPMHCSDVFPPSSGGFGFIGAEYLLSMQGFEKFKQDLGSFSDYSNKYIGFLQVYQNTNYF